MSLWNLDDHFNIKGSIDISDAFKLLYFDQKIRKYPSDVSVSETCIDANLKMVERRDPDNFPHFPPQE